MKPIIHCLSVACGLTLVVPALISAEEKSPVKAERKELRVISGPASERHVIIRDGERHPKPEMEKAAFLGVEVSPVSAVLGSQLGLVRGTGLVVGNVAPKSPASGVLQEHDILLQLDDQILIESRQLAVLVRSRKEGEEVTLTYLRGGQKATAKVKLALHEAPKFSWHEGPGGGALPGILGTGHIELQGGPHFSPQRAETDQILGLLRRPANGDPVRIQIERRDGPGIRAMSINTANSNLVFSDDEGSLELTSKDGGKSLVAKDAKGATIFSGPVSTPEERKALPPALRERLERLEGMREMTFKTDGDFKGAEVRTVRPLGRSISVPAAEPARKRLPGVM